MLVVLHRISITSFRLWCMQGGSVSIWTKRNLFRFSAMIILESLYMLNGESWWTNIECPLFKLVLHAHKPWTMDFHLWKNCKSIILVDWHMSLIDVSWYKGSASDSFQAYTKKLTRQGNPCMVINKLIIPLLEYESSVIVLRNMQICRSLWSIYKSTHDVRQFSSDACQ